MLAASGLLRPLANRWFCFVIISVWTASVAVEVKDWRLQLLQYFDTEHWNIVLCNIIEVHRSVSPHSCSDVMSYRNIYYVHIHTHTRTLFA